MIPLQEYLGKGIICPEVEEALVTSFPWPQRSYFHVRVIPFVHTFMIYCTDENPFRISRRAPHGVQRQRLRRLAVSQRHEFEACFGLMLKVLSDPAVNKPFNLRSQQQLAGFPCVLLAIGADVLTTLVRGAARLRNTFDLGTADEQEKAWRVTS